MLSMSKISKYGSVEDTKISIGRVVYEVLETGLPVWSI